MKNHQFILLFGFVAFMGCNPASVGEDNTLAGKDGNSSTEKSYKYIDAVYRENIRTVLCYRTGSDLLPPLIPLQSTESITLSFDDLDNSVKNLYYSLEHCDSDWKPSSLMEQEYLAGYFTHSIRDYKNSFNTRKGFIHYNLQIPNENTQLTRSGNYLLKVYDVNNPEEILLTRRFMVYESLTNITAEFKRTLNTEERNYKQEIDFVVNTGSLNVLQPYTEIVAIVLQNYRWDNALRNISPRFIKDKDLIYDLDEPNIFDGLNEYRFFDLKTLAYTTPNVSRIIKDSIPYHVLLGNDPLRQYKNYTTSFDLNGKYIIKNDQGVNSDTDADYFWVHFYLPMDTPLDTGEVYIFGALTDWQTREEFRMKYNYRSKKYERAVLLKQGYYTYDYATVFNQSKKVDETFTEGNHFETENNYAILIYYKDLRQSCDRLIGFKQLNTVKR